MEQNIYFKPQLQSAGYISSWKSSFTRFYG